MCSRPQTYAQVTLTFSHDVLGLAYTLQLKGCLKKRQNGL